MLELVVQEIRGTCPVHSKGDHIVISGPNIVCAESDALCTHALSTLLHYTTVLEHAWCPIELGLTTPEDAAHAYLPCGDPGPPYTKGGTVIFRCQRITGKKERVGARMSRAPN
ncbi:MAG: TIGR04076 family protein [Halobacteriota archaeon]